MTYSCWRWGNVDCTVLVREKGKRGKERYDWSDGESIKRGIYREAVPDMVGADQCKMLITEGSTGEMRNEQKAMRVDISDKEYRI